MGNSWTKRHSDTAMGVNGDSIDRSGMEKAYWERYAKWKKTQLKGPVGKQVWIEHPLKFGDSWNPRLNCWWNEIHRGERYPEGHKKQGELTEDGEVIHGVVRKVWKPSKTLPKTDKPAGLPVVTTKKWKRLSHREAMEEED